MKIKDKNIIITGGGRGMGKQFAIDFKERGAKVFIVDVLEDQLEAMKKEWDIPGKLLDVTNEDAVVDFFNGFTNQFGSPHVIINNAGITADGLFIKKKGDEIRKFSLSGWDRVVNVNLKGVFLCAREASYHMVKSEIKGVIINISSISRSGNFGQTNYSATKAGVSSMTVTWAKELAQYGIRAAAIAPGYINTEMVSKINQKVLDGIVKQIPIGRLGEMKEISQAAQFIIECEFFNGRVLEVDGGHRI